MSDFIVITGMSGAGRSQAADDLEDLGWFVVDNLPPPLIPKVAELAAAPGSTIHRVCLVAGTGPYQAEILDALGELRRAGHRVRILFLDAPTDVLVRRYGATRRRHPLAEGEGQPITEAIERERAHLQAVKEQADVVVDTGDLTVHHLKARIAALFGTESPAAGMQTTLSSFGYKHGLPLDVDLVIDCRFLPNPYWVERLRPLSGLDEAVREYVLHQDATADFLDRLGHLLDLLLPAYVREGKTYLSIAFGCTGGRHRSVAIAEEVARRLRRAGYQLSVHHRDVSR